MDPINEAYKQTITPQQINEASPMSVTLDDIKNKKRFITGSTITTPEGTVKVKNVAFSMGNNGKPELEVDIFWKKNDGKSGTQKMSIESFFKQYLNI